MATHSINKITTPNGDVWNLHDSSISSSDITAWNGKSTVSYSQNVSTGTKIGTITINGTGTDIYAPSAGGGGTITEVKTTAGTHTTIDVTSGSAAFNVPTNTSHLVNDSGFITSYTDEKLKWTASTTSNTYYPLVSTSTATTSTANTINGVDFYQYYNTAGGYRRLDLGNTTAYKSSGGAYGTIRLYGAAATYYGDLVPGVLGTTSGDGHISANRTWTLPDKTGIIALTSDLPTSAASSTTGISVAGHSTTTIYGVKSGTNSTTTASKASGSNGTAPTLGTAIKVQSKSSGDNGSASTWAFEDITVPIRADSDTSIPNVTSAGSASSWTFEEKTIPNVTDVGSGSASLTFTMDTTDTKKLIITFSHTHTAPTLGTAIKVQSKSGGSNGSAPTLGTAITVRGVKTGTSSTTTASHVTSGGNGTAASWAFEEKSIPNVTSAGSASTWSFTDVTVPIRADNSTTVATSGTHNVTDTGHTHTLS